MGGTGLCVFGGCETAAVVVAGIALAAAVGWTIGTIANSVRSGSESTHHSHAGTDAQTRTYDGVWYHYSSASDGYVSSSNGSRTSHRSTSTHHYGSRQVTRVHIPHYPTHVPPRPLPLLTVAPLDLVPANEHPNPVDWLELPKLDPGVGVGGSSAVVETAGAGTHRRVRGSNRPACLSDHPRDERCR